jgi:tetratricopeptide (TPR) repeat protein
MQAHPKRSVPATGESATPPDEPTTGRGEKFIRAVMLTGILACIVFLWWNCARNPRINFLPHHAAAPWIVFPLPPDGHIHTVVQMTGIFRRSFVIGKEPSTAPLTWRAFTNAVITINGNRVETPSTGNWKDPLEVDVARFLHSGTNEISIKVANGFAPPALSVSLGTAEVSLNTDAQWECNIMDSEWRPARLATVAPPEAKGNLLDGRENLFDSVRNNQGQILIFAGIALAIVGGATLWNRRAKRFGGKSMGRFFLGLSAVGGFFWLILLIHNFRSLAPLIGYDVEAHLDYIRYVQEKNALPLANEGWEMFQPPLYYIVSALALKVAQLDPSHPTGMLLLRLLALVAAALNVLFVFLSLRLLFPGDSRKPLIGAALAAFLPAQLYLLHYATNETLAAMLVSAAIYCCLRALHEKESGWRWPVATGACLGAAMLTKSSALLAVFLVFGALIGKCFGGAGVLASQAAARKDARATNSIRRRTSFLNVGIAVFAFLAVCGWHYWRVWQQFGNPLIGNWDPSLGRAWWQGPGYHTSAYYFSFGESLTRPVFSSFKSFWDGIYSTMWGDALCGGRADFVSRPPWNYDLMTINYPLALAPTLVILTGIFLAAKNLWQRLRLEWLMLAGLAFVTAFSVLYMSTKLTNYGQAKAFYGLGAMIPLCAFAAVGLEFFLQKHKVIRVGVLLSLAVWLVNSYASFWIQPHKASTCLSIGLAYAIDHEEGAAEKFSEVLRLDPHNAEAWLGRAKLATDAGRDDEALRCYEAAVSANPSNAEAHGRLAIVLALRNKLEEAKSHAHEAARLAPENPMVFDTLCAVLLQGGQTEEALAAGRHSLALAPSPKEVHFNTGLALVNLGQNVEALEHFRAVLQTDHDSPQAHYFLGFLYLKKGERIAAIEHLSEAVRLNPENAKARALLERATGK